MPLVKMIAKTEIDNGRALIRKGERQHPAGPLCKLSITDTTVHYPKRIGINKEFNGSIY